MFNRILLTHGSGGKLTHELIKTMFVKNFSNSALNQLADSAVCELPGKKIAFTTDSYVVNPVFFPGGDIGKLAVCGTVNDLSVAGARPLFISCALIMEEGLETAVLEKIIVSLRDAAKKANVKIVTGDTKVVEKGGADKIFINTAGIGIVYSKARLGTQFIRPGDVVIINGPIANHGMAITALRKGMQFETKIQSDCTNLNEITGALIGSLGKGIKFMRDATRGGLSAVLNEVTEGRAWGIEIDEKSVPVDEPVRAMCELLGFDPLYVANEGKVVAIVAPESAEKALKIMRRYKDGKGAAIIGTVKPGLKGRVELKTLMAGRRIVDMPVGEQLPRIC
ncbi:MAG: hydrogenase expression/formation protein HypE [Planctomycetes bacterium]|nr:hydrogenase expression/formation protein HypE [Planctomycetota bacterium]